MKITYDKNANAAYLYIKDEIKQGESYKTYCCDPKEVDGMINLDFDEHGELLGIEVIGANKKLPQEVLKNALLI